MSLIRINRNPSDRQLAVFGLACLACLGLLGRAAWSHGRTGAAEILWSTAMLVALIGLIRPQRLQRVYLGLSLITYPFGWVLSHIILALVYYLVLTPIGLTLRLFRHDPLLRRFDPESPSYWTPRPPPKSAESYFNQD